MDGAFAEQIAHQRPRIRRRREYVHVRKAPAQPVGFPPSDQTPHKVDHQERIAFLQRPERGQPAAGLILRALAHHAGVKHDHVGFLGVRSREVSKRFQRSGHAAGVRRVHLAAFGPEMIEHGWTDLTPIPLHPFPPSLKGRGKGDGG